MSKKKSTALADEIIVDLLDESVAEEVNDPTDLISSDIVEASKVEPFDVGIRDVGANINPTEASLVQSENLKFAQKRILQLEGENNKLRIDNEKLAAAGESLKKRSEELLSESDNKMKDLDISKSSHEGEVRILKETMQSKKREIHDLKLENEELKTRISSSFQKVRHRERELENRLELAKLESSALIKNKNEMILELKRNLDQLNLEISNFKNKGIELNNKLDSKQDALKRTVRTLRIALTMLEGEEDGDVMKKTGS